MKNFKIGDRVRCINTGRIDSGNQPKLILGREYIIYDIHTCKCGSINLDVGLKTENGYPTICNCNKTISLNDIHWCAAERFERVLEKVEYIAVATNIEIEEPVLN